MSEYLIRVSVFTDNPSQIDAVFDAVADAAHAWGEEQGVDVACSGRFATPEDTIGDAGAERVTSDPVGQGWPRFRLWGRK